MRGGFIMRQMVKKFFVVMMLLLAFVCVMGDDNVSAKVKKKKIKLTTSKNNSDKAIYLSDKVKKIKVTYSKKGIITNGKIDRLGNFKYQVKKPGKTTVTVKAYTKRKKVCGIYKLMLTVKDTRKEDREAFKIQNQYREKKGVSPLKWSDELYKFAEYRMETSGFDSHKNVQRDAKTFSGEKYMIFFRISTLGENLSTATNAVDSMPLWKNSPGHYNNLLNSRWKTGAIYSSSRGTIAVFSEFSKDEIDNWRTYEDWRTEENKIVITRKDSATGTLLSDCQFTIEKVSDGSLVCSVGISSSKTETSTRKLVPGETYKVYEVITPTGYKKAKPITFTVTEGTNYITMTD